MKLMTTNPPTDVYNTTFTIEMSGEELAHIWALSHLTEGGPFPRRRTPGPRDKISSDGSRIHELLEDLDIVGLEEAGRKYAAAMDYA